MHKIRLVGEQLSWRWFCQCNDHQAIPSNKTEAIRLGKRHKNQLGLDGGAISTAIGLLNDEGIFVDDVTL